MSYMHKLDMAFIRLKNSELDDLVKMDIANAYDLAKVLCDDYPHEAKYIIYKLEHYYGSLLNCVAHHIELQTTSRWYKLFIGSLSHLNVRNQPNYYVTQLFKINNSHSDYQITDTQNTQSTQNTQYTQSTQVQDDTPYYDSARGAMYVPKYGFVMHSTPSPIRTSITSNPSTWYRGVGYVRTTGMSINVRTYNL